MRNDLNLCDIQITTACGFTSLYKVFFFFLLFDCFLEPLNSAFDKMCKSQKSTARYGPLKNILRYRITLSEDYYWFAREAVSLSELGWLTGRGGGGGGGGWVARKQPEGTTLLDGPSRWWEIEGRITGIRVSDDCFSNGRERGRLMKRKGKWWDGWLCSLTILRPETSSYTNVITGFEANFQECNFVFVK